MMHPILDELFSPETARWFDAAVGAPTRVQIEGWRAIATGENVLISAPTGSGKTLTAFMTLVDRLDRLAKAGQLENRLYAVYISPLKALGNDIRENLRRPIDGLGAPIRTAVRNGDTTSTERQAMLRKPPHILITTPESLFILLTSQGGRDMLRPCETVIVDEIHALLGEKRGTHLLLSLTRLDALCGRAPQRVALSATLRPLDEAARLIGRARIVAPAADKQTAIRVLRAADDIALRADHSVWPGICRAIAEAAQSVRTVLVFCEGRATAEKVAGGVNALMGEGFALTHHGSMAREARREAELALKSGSLRVLCATSSMELGIDVGEIDLVLQVGCPARVSQAMQRMGRAGHRPGALSRMDLYPRTPQETLLCALTAGAARDGAIEPVTAPACPLDILAQHIVSMAAVRDWTVDELLALVRRCKPYEALTEGTLRRVLAMLAGYDEHDEDRPAAPRVRYDAQAGTVSAAPQSRMLALSSGGTIPDRGLYTVWLEDGVTRLGELDEEFVFEARQGDTFLLGAFAWQITGVTRDRVFVRQAASNVGAQTPFWRGPTAGRDARTGRAFGARLRALETAYHTGRLQDEMARLTGDSDSAADAADLIDRQIRHNGCLATDQVLVAERFRDENGDALMMLHAPLGRPVNQGLALLMRRQAETMGCQDLRVWFDDDGVLLYAAASDIPRGLLGAIDPDGVERALREALPASAQFSIVFRDCMSRALMMGMRPGGRVPLWVQRMRGAAALATAARHPDHPMLVEAMRECLTRSIDTEAVTELLGALRRGELRLVVRDNAAPSPMTLSLRRQLEAELMYDYAPATEATRTLTVDMGDGTQPPPDPDAVSAVSAPQAPPKDEDTLLDRLIAQGDMTADETNAPLEWLESLAARGKAVYAEPGLWIAASDEALYDAALNEADDEALKRVFRRCLRCRGPQTAATLCGRYALDARRVERALNALVAEGRIAAVGESYIHADLYDRAQRLTIRMRREAVRTAGPEAYAALLARGMTATAGSPRERLAEGLARLRGLYLPLEHWESAILPARTTGYRPAMLDRLLSAGAATWRLSADGGALAFFSAEDIDWDAPCPQNDPSDLAQAIRSVLARRGACFPETISAQLHGVSVFDELAAMARHGDAVCDSFAPLRDEPARRGAKRIVRARLARSGGMRWELARPVREMTLQERLDQAFDRWEIVCRETAAAEGLNFGEALGLLRKMEYTGACRRGYFVSGLSGAQFVRAEAFDRITAALAEPDRGCVCFSAVDPALAWKRLLKWPSDNGFLAVPGTAVVLESGHVALIAERSGHVLRAPEPSEAAVRALAAAYDASQIFPDGQMLVIKEYPASLEPALKACGFVREMNDYVLQRKPGYLTRGAD